MYVGKIFCIETRLAIGAYTTSNVTGPLQQNRDTTAAAAARTRAKVLNTNTPNADFAEIGRIVNKRDHPRQG